MKHGAFTLFTLAAMGAAHAHDGHSAATGVHWHATDAVGLIVAAVAVAAVWWLGRGE